MMHTPNISPIESGDLDQTNAHSTQSRWHTLGGFKPEPGTLDMSDHHMAVLERRQNLAEAMELDSEKLDPYVEPIACLDCPRMTSSECSSLNSSDYTDVETLGRGHDTIERNNACLSLFDATKHDWRRFNAVADETGIAVRDDWKLDDLAMALARGDANKTVGDRIRDAFKQLGWVLGFGLDAE